MVNCEEVASSSRHDGGETDNSIMRNANEGCGTTTAGNAWLCGQYFDWYHFDPNAPTLTFPKWGGGGVRLKSSKLPLEMCQTVADVAKVFIQRGNVKLLVDSALAQRSALMQK